MSAKFLLRFDDMCPTINWDVWQKLEDIMVAENICPILSVIPDNQDPKLHEGPSNERFWERVRAWQEGAWVREAAMAYARKQESGNRDWKS